MTKFNLYFESRDLSASVAWSETVIVSISSVLLFLDFARRDEDARLNLKAWSEVFLVATNLLRSLMLRFQLYFEVSFKKDL